MCRTFAFLRAIKELTQENISYKSDTGNTYDFNTADNLNTLLLNSYKKFLGYRPGVAVIGDLIVGIENSDGNTNVRFHQKDTLNRFFERLERKGLIVNRFRADCGSCSDDIVEEVEKHCKTFYIRANRCSSLYNDIFALRGLT